jgi:hypothetical protein
MIWTVTKKSGTSASCGGEGIDLKYAGQRAACKLEFWFQRVIYDSSS